MQRQATSGLLTTILVLIAAAPVLAQPDQPDVLPKEFTCMATQPKAGAKFFAAKVKCVSRCLSYYWKGLGSQLDCMPPYSGDTALCVNDTVYGTKGAENKFGAALDKACVNGPGADCPECYASGCSTTETQNLVQQYEGNFDSFMPGFFCEITGAVKAEQKCQLYTAKGVAKYYATRNKCYTKCLVDARSGGDTTTCLPPVSDADTLTCLANASTKAVLQLDKYCNPTYYPDSPPDCAGGYPSGASWAHLIDFVVDPTVAPTFCASPSVAFVD